MTEVFKTCGPAPLMRSEGTAVPDITNILISILTKRHICQQDIGEEGGDDDDLEGSSEYDWYVIDTALDTVGALSIALGDSFGELWKIFEKTVFKFCSSSEANQRNSAVGIVAECISGMGGAVTPYTENFFRVLMHRLGDEDSDVKSNAAFAVGVLLQNTGDEGSLPARFGPVLQKLEPIIDGQPKGSRLVDNAAGCVSRLISRNPSLVPLDEVLPRLVSLLPLQEDLPENVPVFKMIVKLYRDQNTVIQGLTQQLMPVFEKVLSPPEEQLDDETRAMVVELVEYIRKQ
jgi:importin-4